MKTSLSQQKITESLKQLNTLLASGYPITTSLQLLRQQENNSLLKKYWLSTIRSLESGKKLSRSLKKHFPVLKTHEIAFIKLGEETGYLIKSLNALIQHREMLEKSKKQWLQAISYPLFLLGFSLIAITYLLHSVIPQFSSLYTDFESELPAYTQFVLHLSNGLEKYSFHILFFFIFFIIFLWIAVKKNMYFLRFLQKIFLNMPGINSIIKIYWFSHCLHQLTMSLKSGLSLLTALQLAKKSSFFSFHQDILISIKNSLLNGFSFHKALQETDYFDYFVLQIIFIAEESGTLDHALEYLSNHYQEQLRSHLQRLSQWAEPVIMMIISLMIGALVIALYLPIFKLGTVIR